MGSSVVSGSGIALAALTEPEALTVHLEDVDVVGQAVEYGARQSLRAVLGPFVEGQVRGSSAPGFAAYPC
jgi:hypothetical protein